MTVQIREANKSDATAISELVILLTTKYVLPDMSDVVGASLLKTMSVEGIEKNMQYDINYQVAELDGCIVGLLGMKKHKHIYHLFVDDNYHRQGIAKKLWTSSRQACIDAGYENGYTVNSSLYARLVYEKLGFVATKGIVEHQGTKIIPMTYKL